MRLDHLLSREILIRIRLHCFRFQKIQHPAPGAPAPRHLDSRIAKHGIQKIRGAGKPFPGPRERITKSIHIKLIRILHDRKIIQDLLDVVYLTQKQGTLQDEDTKGARRMPWRGKSTKGAASCDKPRGGANGLRSADSRMGEPSRGNALLPAAEPIGGQEATGGTETSKYPEEEKSTEIPGVAASETGPAQTGARASVRAFPRRCCWAGQPRAASLGRCYKPAI